MTATKVQQKQISFKVTLKERAAIDRIAKRAVALCEKAGVPYDELTAEMDLAACNANGCPLDFAKLEQFKGFDFAHDIFGIRAHLNRETAELSDFFPRCAIPQKLEGGKG
jgi:hypothetical protein